MRFYTWERMSSLANASEETDSQRSSEAGKDLDIAVTRHI